LTNALIEVATYDLKPEMSAYEVTERLVEAIDGGRYDAIVCNYANGDMVGHTGNFDAARRAIEALDTASVKSWRRRVGRERGALSDIAPTLLALMGLPKPAEMTGHSLVRLASAG
jgi:2,3-bisphosphoglycerate-independent phosphoglycerate mutase